MKSFTRYCACIVPFSFVVFLFVVSTSSSDDPPTHIHASLESVSATPESSKVPEPSVYRVSGPPVCVATLVAGGTRSKMDDGTILSAAAALYQSVFVNVNQSDTLLCVIALVAPSHKHLIPRLQ
eukprot:PhF_6_TR22316/c0_g1_i2/m.31589